MEQFSLEKYLENTSRKVVTRDGREVSIERIDLRGHFPILAIISNNSEDYDIPMTYNNKGKNIDTECEGSADLFFADEEKCNKILNELKSYLKNTPKEQVEKDWKEIQDWYVQHFTNEKHDEEEELTEFEKKVLEISGKNYNYVPSIKVDAQILLDLARKYFLKDLPKWNKEPYAQNGIDAEGTVYYNGWSISLEELFKILPKE